ncbi:phage tail assembly chaperone [Pseudomonas plecoglossicida]|uniref:phage tail assembly chaperone n=1 Tax=Pseudomonas plecoglossicida TaxID=70775 RepID=UPI0015E32D14|nr:phage tail assembly chaperone [Pseudomonas plecoglossicida]MBA1322957.1 phage tail protein [Pseudomonas plecoglossicida]
MNIWAKFEENGRYSFSLDDNGGVKISAERHAELRRAESTGKVLMPDNDGDPEIFDPMPSEDDLREGERRWRSAELARYEWVATRHRDEQDMGGETSLTGEQYAGLLKYRQDLRDWPAADAFPVIGERPSPPDWLVGLTQ